MQRTSDQKGDSRVAYGGGFPKGETMVAEKRRGFRVSLRAARIEVGRVENPKSKALLRSGFVDSRYVAWESFFDEEVFGSRKLNLETARRRSVSIKKSGRASPRSLPHKVKSVVDGLAAQWRRKRIGWQLLTGFDQTIQNATSHRNGKIGGGAAELIP